MSIKTRIPALDVYVVWTPPGQTEQMIAYLLGRPMVLYAEHNYLATASLTPSDPDYNDPGKVWAPQRINAEAGWNITTGSSNVIVAVVDTGVRHRSSRIRPCGRLQRPGGSGLYSGRRLASG